MTTNQIATDVSEPDTWCQQLHVNKIVIHKIRLIISSSISRDQA